ncbi:hypothetical protein WJX75_005528 [Coccomyxa subellipsoidea]|uniref:USP domain-containing protein n=1 Tax=Coccomyxa subellipsoidea TaxID=248742 RepID=A0ABR2YY33_9CHLO
MINGASKQQGIDARTIYSAGLIEACQMQNHPSQAIEKQTGSAATSTPTTTHQHKPTEAAGAEHAIVYGLNNLGNTCFYNSALQALVSVPALRDFYTKPQKGPQLQKGPIGAALQEVVQTVYGHRDGDQAQSAKAAKVSRREGTPLFSPSRLRAAVIKIAPRFKGYQQQDSHELVRCLIDGLLAEEGNAISYLKEQNEDASVPPGFIEELFSGELSSRVVCKTCNHETVNLEKFYDLSLPIPASLPTTSGAGTRSKPKGKGPKSQGKASIERPVESPAAEEQQKLTAKQRKKAEKDARRKEQIARKKQRKRGSQGNGAAQPASSRRSAQTRIPSEVTPLGSSQSDTSTEVLPDSDGTPDEHADRELTSSAESPSLESRPPAYGEQLGVGLTNEEEAALYGDLDALQEDASGLGDLSDTEADVSDVKEEQLKSSGVGSSGQGESEPEAADEEMTALGSLFEEDTPDGSSKNGLSWTETAELEHVSHEVNIQSCMTAFFAREVIEWECPAESAAASKQRREEQALASASLDGTPQPLRRRSVSFSEEKPRIKFIPGSAEQRGTNFVRALQGDRPFCRPLKHKGGCFLLNAYVDNITKDKLHLGLQGQDDNDATLRPLRDVHAINSRIEFGSVPISPVEDPEDEDEQSRVRSQAQALLDCVADLIVHSGLQGAINLLTEGAQLQRIPSGMGSLGSPRSGSDSLSRMGSETWRIVGSLPPGFGEGAWEYPPPRDDSQGLSPNFRSHSTDVYVPTDTSDKGARPGSLGTGAASSKLPASFWARYAATHEPIMEAAQEGSIDTDSQTSGELPLPLTPHNSLNEEATSGTQSGNGSADVAPGNNSQPSGQPQRGGAGSGAAGKRRSKKKPAPLVLETRNSFTITAEVPVSPFSNDPEGRLLSNGWEPSWPVQLPAGERDSSEAYCRIFCSDKGRKSARPLSLRSDSATAADSPFGSRASSRGYFADSEEDADSTRGNAVFWAGSKSLGISFVDEPEEAAPAPGPARFTNGDMHLPGGNESAADLEVELGAGWKAQSLPSPRATAAAAAAAADAEAEAGPALQRRLSKGILRKSVAAISIKREAVKGYLIHRAPEVLTLHLKRFQQDMRGRCGKINGAVPFPADLDITPYCDPKGKDAAGAQYTLVGVVEQQGSMLSGHYWAYVARQPPATPPPPPQTKGSPAQSPSGQTPQMKQRQDSGGSFNGDDAVPLAPAHKTGCGAKSAYRGVNAAKPGTSTSETFAESLSQGAVKSGNGSSKEDGCADGEPSREAGRQQPPPSRLAGSRPKLDSAELQWFHASDEKVKHVSWDTVAACHAYLLLYGNQTIVKHLDHNKTEGGLLQK